MLYTTVDAPREVVEKKIMDVIKVPQVASVATIHEGKPWVRYMVVFSAGEGLMLATTSGLNSRKINHMQDNPHVHLTLGPAGTDPKFMGPYLQFAGTVEVRTDKETKHKFWNDMLKAYYQGPDDPNYTVLLFKPETIELWGDSENPYQPYIWKA